jgi:predicted transposase YdaD
MSKQIKPTLQHQDFDKILKKTFNRIYESLIHKLLKFEHYEAIKLPNSYSRTKEKHLDFVVKVTDNAIYPYIAHIEFQTKSEKNMDKRMLGYYCDLYWEFDFEIIQYVIYLGEKKHNMTTDIHTKNLKYTYEIISLNELDVNNFLESNLPNELILAILCKYEKKEAPKIIESILQKLQKITQNGRELYEFTTDLEILSELRKLQFETKNQVDKMPIAYDLKKDPRFLEGKLEGKLEGQKEGQYKKARVAVINLLKTKTLSIEQIAQVLEVSIDFVKAIQEELTKNPYLR